MSKLKIALIVGSLRKESYARKLALQIAALSSAEADFTLLDIGSLPLYNEDLDTDQAPNSWVEFRNQLKAADGVLFVTPEYNRSIPGCLKNAIDVGSRPPRASAWAGLPAATASHSQGAMGGEGSHLQLRQLVPSLNMPMMPQPELYLGNSGKLFADKTEITDPAVIELLKKFSASMIAWMKRLEKAKA